MPFTWLAPERGALGAGITSATAVPPGPEPYCVVAAFLPFLCNAASLFRIVNGRARPGMAVPVVPQSLLCVVVAPDIGPVAPSFDVDASFML
jgi:hypothetical protein